MDVFMSQQSYVWCSLITSEKHSRKEAGTHLLCVLTFNTPPELYLELRKTKENGKLRTIVQSAKNAYY